jgi:hypothetical protein
MAVKQILDGGIRHNNRTWAKVVKMDLTKFNRIEAECAMWMKWDLVIFGTALKIFREIVDKDYASAFVNPRTGQYPTRLIAHRLLDPSNWQ